MQREAAFSSAALGIYNLCALQYLNHVCVKGWCCLHLFTAESFGHSEDIRMERLVSSESDHYTFILRHFYIIALFGAEGFNLILR